MDLSDALARRRSCRAFLEDPVPAGVLARVLGAALRGPTAGNSWGLDLVVLEGTATARYWDASLPIGPARDGFRWPGLLRAPVLVVPVVDPAAYVARYAEADKAPAGLGESVDAWPVPYWWVDAGAAVMAMLLAATAEGLGTLLFGTFGHAAAVGASLGVPEDRELLGCVAIGRPDTTADRRSASAERGRPPLDRVVHRSGW